MATKKAASQDVTVYEPESFAVLANPERSSDVIAQLKEAGVGPWKIKRLKVPAGGGSAWEVPVLGGIEPVRELDGIIASVVSNQRAWYIENFENSGGGSPPDCSSTDGIHGHGINTLPTPGEPEPVPGVHECAMCPWSQFGSDRVEGRAGQDCSQSTFLFVFTEKGMLPKFLRLPPTSLSNWSKYQIDLWDEGLLPSQVVTRFTLETHDKPMKHSRAVFSFAGMLDQTSVDRFSAMAEKLSETFKRAAEADVSSGAAAG